jgi:copper homeostasis protein (lipoprotein)
MKKIIATGIFMICFSGLFLCEAQSSSKKKTTKKTSAIKQSASHWDGVYKGVLPCADCEGIQTSISLKNMTYKVTTKYLGKSDSIIKYSGKFKRNQQANTIILTNPDNKGWTGTYLVGKNTLTQLDGDGKIITGPLADKFVLSKSNN